nr:agmatine deiminase family protein [Rhodococcus wratislaviensis]GLK33411.1 putative agmatine deiminase [Rhodococcus wratislaviensis]
MTWHMPSETSEHERIWMAFPVAGYTLGDDATSADEARSTWAAVAHAVAEFEPVTMVVDPNERDIAARYLSSSIEVVDAPLDDSWMRDMGPTYVYGSDGGLAAVDWTFNAWGAPEWALWEKDREIAKFVAGLTDTPRILSTLVNEGGGIHVDGEGTVIITETVQLDPGRNPYTDKERVEAELERTIGASNVIWLPRGLTRDYEIKGTRGHVDMIACIPSPGTILLHAQNDQSHPDYDVSRQLKTFIEGTRDASGREWNIIDLPAPDTLKDDEGFVDYNYVNHLVVNGGIIACGFGEAEADARARSILADAYPGRRVVTVDARPLFVRGGGVHCITQQQPVAAKP